MTYISSCGDLCDDEDIYPCVLEYLDEEIFVVVEEKLEDIQVQSSSYDEIALSWERRLRL